MLLRVLTMKVHPERIADWMAYTKQVGFPGMLGQPGCTRIWRMRRPDAEAGEYQVVTLWDSAEDLARFKSSDAMRGLAASAAGLTIPPHGEDIYETVPD